MPIQSFLRRVALRCFTAALIVVPMFQAYVARAQTRTLATAEVPFDFNAGAVRLPAGSYRIVQVNQNMMRVVGEDNRHIASIMVFPSDKRASGDQGKLQFHEYGSRYFLSAVLLANDKATVDVVKNRAEKEAMQIAASRPSSTIITEVAVSGGERR